MRGYCAPKTTWKPPWRGWRDATESQTSAAVTKCQKNRQAFVAAGRDVKMRSEIGLERYQAQPKWEIPDYKANAAHCQLLAGPRPPQSFGQRALVTHGVLDRQGC